MEERKKYEVVKPIIANGGLAFDEEGIEKAGLHRKGTVFLDPSHPVTKKWLNIGAVVEHGQRPPKAEKKETQIRIGKERTAKEKKRGKR